MAKIKKVKPKTNHLLSLPTPFKRFHLMRDKDVSGVSGTGIVACGVVFPDHSAVVKWLSEVHSTIFYTSISEVEKIHGHGGSTKIEYID
jgi:hypothetical protein